VALLGGRVYYETVNDISKPQKNCLRGEAKKSGNHKERGKSKRCSGLEQRTGLHNPYEREFPEEGLGWEKEEGLSHSHRARGQGWGGESAYCFTKMKRIRVKTLG